MLGKLDKKVPSARRRLARSEAERTIKNKKPIFGSLAMLGPCPKTASFAPVFQSRTESLPVRFEEELLVASFWPNSITPIFLSCKFNQSTT
ncbi:MAG TPA: hypothetical protein VG649_09030, partial [Candidatus Angelobacter sp.]|nr:hypothetical protein [Candidatus Angelobacter sp.]